MVGRFQTRDKAKFRPHLFQVATATPRVTPNTFLRGLLSLDQNVAAMTAAVTTTPMTGTKRSGSEMDDSATSTAKTSRKQL
jgi:hypothetical protein